MVRFDLGSLLQGQMRTAKLKTAYNSLIIGPRGLQCEPTYRKSWAANFFDVGLLHILDTILVHCILHILGTILVHCLI